MLRYVLLSFLLFQAPSQKDAKGPSVLGKGVQIYVCSAGGVWAFEAPEATLYLDNVAVGSHSKGPTWTWKDGSAVTGKLSGTRPSPDGPQNIPWLSLNATEVPGRTGVLTGTIRVTRWETKGGVAPTSGCDEWHVGQKVRVPYEAMYSFLRASDLKP
jgi:Protein of unknown function (DUF3455)